MRPLRRSLEVVLWATLSLIVTAPLGALSQTPARADNGPLSIDLPGYFDLVVDDAGKQVFVSEGPEGAGIEVVGFDGTVAQISLPGATGMALRGRSLYVADAI